MPRTNCLALKSINEFYPKWSFLILNELNRNKKTSFNHLLHALTPISSKVLAKQLEQLAKIGLIKKNNPNEKPTYSIKAIGQTFHETGMTLMESQVIKKGLVIQCNQHPCIGCPRR